MIAIAIYAFLLLVFCGQAEEFYSFEPGCARPGLATGGLRVGVL